MQPSGTVDLEKEVPHSVVTTFSTFFEDTPLSASDIARIKVKENGAERRVGCYMSIGEAEDYRYYWEDDWAENSPAWLGGENPDWEGNY